MPKLVRLYITQVCIGFAVSAGFVALLLLVNVGNLAHLVTSSPIGWLAVVMLWLFNGIVFAGVQFALALPRGHDDGGDRGSRPKTPISRHGSGHNQGLIPIPVEARDPRNPV